MCTRRRSRRMRVTVRRRVVPWPRRRNVEALRRETVCVWGGGGGGGWDNRVRTREISRRENKNRGRGRRAVAPCCYPRSARRCPTVAVVESRGARTQWRRDLLRNVDDTSCNIKTYTARLIPGADLGGERSNLGGQG